MEPTYIVNALPYFGKDELRPPSQRLSDRIVLQLMGPYLGKGTNVTTYNFFTSWELAKELKKRELALLTW